MTRHDGPVFGRGLMRQGRLRLQQANRFAAQLQQLRDGVVEIAVARKRATRSQQANRYWWGVCVAAVADHTGYTPNEIHELAKQMFLPKRLAVADGLGEIRGEYVIGASTTRLTTAEFAEFVESFRQWAADTLDVSIPAAEGASEAWPAQENGRA
jgi:hypothetical protein